MKLNPIVTGVEVLNPSYRMEGSQTWMAVKPRILRL